MAESDGFGTLKTMSGPRYILSTRDGGYMSMLVKKRGTIHVSMLKVRLFVISSMTTSSPVLGWKKKIAYCIAFSIDGASDVTRRYVRDPPRHALDRTRCPEEVLLWILQEIKRMRRDNMPKEDKRRLMREDDREERELRGYTAQALAAEIGNLIPGSIGSPVRSPSDELKLPAGRQSGTTEWVNARGESGTGQPGPDRPQGGS